MATHVQERGGMNSAVGTWSEHPHATHHPDLVAIVVLGTWRLLDNRVYGFDDPLPIVLDGCNVR